MKKHLEDEIIRGTISCKICEAYLCFGIVFIHWKWSRAGLLQPEVDCMSCRTAYDLELGNKEILRKFQSSA